MSEEKGPPSAVLLANRRRARKIWSVLAAEGMRLAVLCPGSRNSPFLLETEGFPGIEFLPHFDERGAGFFALGAAKATGLPVAVCVTSGSALANLMPAVVEAHETGLRLVVLTADRPPELQGIGANQTIRQSGFFGVFADRFLEAHPPEEGNEAALLAEITEAVRLSPGPVHFNQMFREPLAGVEMRRDPEFGIRSEVTEPNHPAMRETERTGDPSMARGGWEIAEQGGLLLVGELSSHEEREAAAAWIVAWAGPVHVDFLSGLRSEEAGGPFDRLLVSADADREVPISSVLHLGGRFLSKPLETFLSRRKPSRWIRWHRREERIDPLRLVTESVRADWTAWRPESAQRAQVPPKWIPNVRSLERDYDEFCEQEPLLPLRIPGILAKALPASTLLFAGNSLPVRDLAAWFHHAKPDVLTLASRGASGIDGLLSTALGASRGVARPCCAVLGDLSALHDLSSLSLLSSHPHPFVLVVINNGGGGIFGYLPVKDDPGPVLRHVIQPHPFDFSSFARGFGVAYASVSGTREFSNEVVGAFAKAERKVIEVRIDREEQRASSAERDRRVREILASADS